MPSRAWSQELGVSRSTVENAYAELVTGWLNRAGTGWHLSSERDISQQSTITSCSFCR
ncbi:hypothetical protein MJ581_15465 [Escherichia coli]|nr:hypothetical protein MJ581_15465 [Escherichia coli]